MDLYSHVIFHFISQPSQHLLKQLAKNIVKKKNSALSKIIKVQHSSLGFYCIDQKMAILPDHTSVLNLLLTLKNPPIIVYGSKQQQMATILYQRIQSYSQKLDKSSYTLLLLFNRQLDYFPVFAHGITYGALLQDIYTINAHGNKVSFENTAKQLDLNDKIWLERKNLLINQMNLQRQLNHIKTNMMGINNKVDQLNELSERQKQIQWHVETAQQLLKQAKKRRLDQYYDIETQIYSKKLLNKQTKRQLIEILQKQQNKEDKVRIMMIYIHYCENLDDLKELQSSFGDILKNTFYNEIKAKRLKDQEINNSSKYFKKLAQGIWKNLVAVQKKFTVTKYLEKVREFNLGDIGQLGLFVKGGNPEDRIRFNQIIVHCVGGVTLNQYANITEYDPTVFYTGDKFINFKSFKN